MTANRNTKTPRSKSAKKWPRSRITDEQIAKLYDGGASPKQISKRAGISEKAVRGHIRKTGRTLRPRSPWTTEQLADLYFGRQPDQSQHSLQEIQDVTGIHVSTVSGRLRRAKYKLRGRGGQPGKPKRPDIQTDDLKKAYTEMREAGEKPHLSAIAERFNTTRPTVAYRLKGVHVPSQPHKVELSPEQQAEVARMYAEGCTQAKIAARLGIGSGTMSRIFKKLGLETRSKSEQMRARHAEMKAKLQKADSVFAADKPKERKPRGRRPKTALYERAEQIHSGGRTWPQVAEILLPEESSKNRHAVAESLRLGVHNLQKLRRKQPVKNSPTNFLRP